MFIFVIYYYFILFFLFLHLPDVIKIEFISITAYALHTTQWKHLQITLVLLDILLALCENTVTGKRGPVQPLSDGTHFHRLSDGTTLFPLLASLSV